MSAGYGLSIYVKLRDAGLPSKIFFVEILLDPRKGLPVLYALKQMLDGGCSCNFFFVCVWAQFGCFASMLSLPVSHSFWLTTSFTRRIIENSLSNS